MSKKVYDDKTISRIIEKGTAKEKLDLAAEHRARKNFARAVYIDQRVKTQTSDPLLTRDQYLAMAESFKKSQNDINTWNKWIELDDTISRAIVNLNTANLLIEVCLERIVGYSFHLINLIELGKVFKKTFGLISPEQRTKLGKDLEMTSPLMFCKFKANPKSITLNLKDKEADGIYPMLDDTFNLIVDRIQVYKTQKKAILDFMNQNDMKVTVYVDFIKEMDKTLKRITDMRKRASDYDERTLRALGLKSASNIFTRYFPEVNKIGVNDQFLRWFNKEVMNEEG